MGAHEKPVHRMGKSYRLRKSLDPMTGKARTNEDWAGRSLFAGGRCASSVSQERHGWKYAESMAVHLAWLLPLGALITKLTWNSNF